MKAMVAARARTEGFVYNDIGKLVDQGSRAGSRGKMRPQRSQSSRRLGLPRELAQKDPSTMTSNSLLARVVARARAWKCVLNEVKRLVGEVCRASLRGKIRP